MTLLFVTVSSAFLALAGNNLGRRYFPGSEARKEEVSKAMHGCYFRCHPGYVIYPVHRSQEVDLSSCCMCRQQPLVVRRLGSLSGVGSKHGAVAERRVLLHEQFRFSLRNQ